LTEFLGAGAETLEFAVWTIRVAGHAAAAAVPDEEVTPEGPDVLRDSLDEVLFDFDRVGFLVQSEAFAQPGDVGVDDDTGFDAEGVAENNIGGFASDPGEMGERFQVAGDFTVMVLDQGVGGGDEVFRFVAEETGGADEFFDVFLFGGGEMSGVRVFFEEGEGHHVDAHVGALRGEDGGDEKLEGPLVVEFAMGVGVGGAEDAKKLAGASVASDG
jgi:hypothetical protein